MSNEYAIRVKNVRKSYKLYFDKGSTIKERVLQKRRGKYETRTVLDGISFEIQKGESVGLIGENGCGKSTTLKLLTKIIFPDSGTIETCGRVSSLLELGAGFHPDMSGRENIYINASIFGIKAKEVDQRLNDIIRFSELEEFIDNPVRTYSSGMYMRLAFSVAINVNADILLIDEILAVGDVSFQKKCMDKIKEIKASGTTIILVSHSMGQIESVCEKVIWLEQGRVKEIGASKEVDDHYREYMEEKRVEKVRQAQREDAVCNQEKEEEQFNKLTIRNGNRKVRFTKVWLEDINGKQQDVFGIGSDMVIKAEYVSDLKNEIEGIMSLAFTRQDEILCYATNNIIGEKPPVQLGKQGCITVGIKDCELLPGVYMLNVALTSFENEIYDDLQRVIIFTITGSQQEQGICRIHCEWEN